MWGRVNSKLSVTRLLVTFRQTFFCSCLEIQIRPLQDRQKDYDIPVWNERGPNKCRSKPCVTLGEKKIATINYFWLINSIHP